MRSVKCVVVGDGGVGKTAFLQSYTSGTFPEEHIATVFDNYAINLLVDGEQVNLQLWDTAGQQSYETVRSLSYAQADVFVIVFSLASKESLENVERYWVDEVRSACPGVPYVLVGAKSDLRDDEGSSATAIPTIADSGECAPRESPGQLVRIGTSDDEVSSRARAVAEAIGAEGYIECSALTQEGLAEAFVEIVRVALRDAARVASDAKPPGEGRRCAVA